MAGVQLKFNVEWNDSEMARELEAAVAQYAPAVQAALEAVSSETKEKLEEHIQSDVYAKWTPKTYIRRKENGGLLDDSSVTVPYAIAQAHGLALRGLMTVRYQPSGASDQWENPAHGDALISRIESGEGYEWRRHPGARPFWTNLVQEMVDGNGLATSFDSAMSSILGPDYEGGSVVEREADDGQFQR